MPRSRVARGGEGEADSGGDAESCGRGHNVDPVGGYILERLGVERGDEAEVVEAGDAAVGESDDSDPDVAGVDGGGEDVELAEETAGEGDADEREQEEGKQCGEDRAAQGEAGKVPGGAGGLIVAGDLRNDSECADVHGGIGGGIEADGGDAVRGECGEGDKYVTGVGNAGVGQHALDIFLK